ncbi:MAG: permease prefix domain 2-containing transporter, partial [Bacteroidota bacterium]
MCKGELMEVLLGDLYELYEWRKQKRGELYARFFFVLGALDLLRPFAWKNQVGLRLYYHLDMIKHYFKIGWRSLWRHRSFSPSEKGDPKATAGPTCPKRRSSYQWRRASAAEPRRLPS